MAADEIATAAATLAMVIARFARRLASFAKPTAAHAASLALRANSSSADCASFFRPTFFCSRCAGHPLACHPPKPLRQDAPRSPDRLAGPAPLPAYLPSPARPLERLRSRLVNEAVSGCLRRKPSHRIGFTGEDLPLWFELPEFRADDKVACHPTARRLLKVSLHRSAVLSRQHSGRPSIIKIVQLWRGAFAPAHHSQASSTQLSAGRLRVALDIFPPSLWPMGAVPAGVPHIALMRLAIDHRPASGLSLSERERRA